MRIVQLTAENVKRLKAVNIRPDGHVVVITGRNGQGKSSVLDSIVYALGGKSVEPAKPVREGADKARVVLDLDEITVTKKWNKDGVSTLEVTSKGGARFPSPQAMLDGLIGPISFDPLSFARSDAKEQMATLATIAGINLAEYTRKRKEIFDSRTVVNRDVKALETQVATISFPHNTPQDEISVTALMDEQRGAIQQREKNASARAALADCKAQAERHAATVENLKKQLALAESEFQSASDRVQKGEKFCENLVDPDVETISQKIRDSQTINANVTKRKEKAAKEARLDDLKKQSEKLTAEIEKMDSEKNRKIAEAPLPVKGLELTDDGVLYNGIPFSQASSAEQLRVSSAIGFGMNKKLKLMLIRDGSLIDSSGMELLQAMAEEQDAQIIIERVSNGEKIGIVIEDGSVVSAEEGAAK